MKDKKPADAGAKIAELERKIAALEAKTAQQDRDYHSLFRSVDEARRACGLSALIDDQVAAINFRHASIDRGRAA